MKYISLGNNCAAAAIIRMLKKRDAAYPFDWVPGSIGIVLHCLQTDFKYFYDFGKPRILPEINEECVFHQNQVMPHFPITHKNYYGQNYTHDTDETIPDLKEKMKRRCDRFIDVLKGDEPVIFIYTNEYTVYFRRFRENQLKHHKILEKVDKLLTEKYPNLQYRIVSFNLNETVEDSGNIRNIRMNWSPQDLFNRGCNQIRIFQKYKDKGTKLFHLNFDRIDF